MDQYIGVILGGFIGLLVGIIATSLTIYPKMMNKFGQIGEICSRQQSEISTLFRDRDRLDLRIGETLNLIKSVVEQNNVIIEKVLTDGKKKP